MTPRTVSEWIGATADTAIPARVKIRVFDAHDGKCAHCGIRLGGSVKVEYDHATALILGGENRESNIQPLCSPCHKIKTGGDVREKSKTARIRAKHLGIEKRSTFSCSRQSKWKKKIDGTVVLR